MRVACFRSDAGESRAEVTLDQTDISGQVKYTGQLGKRAEKYSVEISADRYFASLGMICSQREITILFRVLDPADEYQVMSVLTPFMQATYCVRQSRA